MVDPVALRALIAIADTGSVSAAAALLNYTPSNVTQHVRRLERMLGTALLERVGRGVVLTEPARALVERGRPIVLALDDLAAAAQAAEPKGVVRVGAFPTALRGLVIPAIRALAAKHPALVVRPVEMEPAQAVRRVRGGMLDIAITKTWGSSSAAGGDDELHRESLGIDPVDVVLPRDHRLAGRAHLKFDQLTDERWATMPEDDPFRRWLAARSGHLDDAASVYEAAEFQSLIEYVAHGLAIAAIPRLGRGMLPDTVVAVPLADDSAYRELALIVRRNAVEGAALSATIDAIRRQTSAAM